METPEPYLKNKLSLVFAKTTNSYKFFWFLAFIEEVLRTDDLRIPIERVAMGMVAKAWYPVNFFRINFGKQDRMAEIVKEIMKEKGWQENMTEAQVKKGLLENLDPKVEMLLQEIIQYVPYRFIRPWFAEKLQGKKDTVINSGIIDLANESFAIRTPGKNRETAPPYRFIDKDLFLNSYWIPYIRENYKILEGFALSNLLEYLQKRNPNIPNLVSKLSQPLSRSLSNPRKYWKSYLEVQPAFKCIYSQQSLDPSVFDLDHFLPWSYLAHDMLWNLIPVSATANNSKNNRLPSLHCYFHAFAKIQKQFFDFYYDRRQFKLLEDYSMLLNKEIAEIRKFKKNEFTQEFSQNIKPQFEIATNMGFLGNWVFLKNPISASPSKSPDETSPVS